jgi:hypothetical protein
MQAEEVTAMTTSYRRIALLAALGFAICGLLDTWVSAQDADSRPTVSQGEHTGSTADVYGVVAPASFDFGEVLINQASPQMHFGLTNTGSAELTVSSISIAGPFALPVNHCADGVKPGTRCDVYVSFTPTTLGQQTGTLTFTDNATNSPQTVMLSGTGSNTAPTMTTLTSSLTHFESGQSIVLTATVKSLGGGVIPDGEQVAFSFPNAGQVLGYGTLQSGVATLTTSSIVCFNPKIVQTIVAQYVGDQTFLTSQTKIQVHVVQQTPIVSVSSSPNPSVFGQDVAIIGTVTSVDGHAATGPMGLYGVCGYWKVLGSQHVCQDMRRRDVGTYQIGAYYFGDNCNGPAQSPTGTHVINPESTTTSIVSTKNPSAQGQAIKLRVFVKAQYGGPVQGSVTLTSGGTNLGTIQLETGEGYIDTSTLPVGQDTITVTYNPPNGNYIGSSASLIQVIK